MESIGTSLDRYVEEFLAGFEEGEREQVLSDFRRVMEGLCSGGDPALTTLIESRRQQEDLVEKLLKLDRRVRQARLRFDLAAPGLPDDEKDDIRRALVECRLALLILRRMIAEGGEAIERALRPLIVDALIGSASKAGELRPARGPHVIPDLAAAT